MNILLSLLFLLFAAGAAAKDDSTERVVREIPQAQMTVRVQYYSPGIVRVKKWPSSLAKEPEKGSFSVILKPDAKALSRQISVESGIGHTMLKSAQFSVIINETTGQLTFSDAGGNVLLTECRTGFEMRQGDADEGKYRISQAWRLADDEQVFGLGQLRDEAMSHRGRKVEIWNHNTYISIPYFTSEKGYGIYWDNAGRSLFDDSQGGETVMSSEVGMCADYYFMYDGGTQDGVIGCIRQLTGQATMFPLWTMGHWQCRERYKTSDELCEVLDKYRELRIPLDAIVQDWQYWGCDSNWNAMRFENPYYINKVGDEKWEKYLPKDLRKMAAEYKAQGKQPRIKSPQEMVDYVHRHDAHLMISIWANFGPWTAPFARMKEIGALMPFDTWPMKSGVQPYDPFNPKARDVYWHFLSHLYGMGFDAWWTDSTEPDHFNESQQTDDYMTYAGTWRSVKNAFPLMTNRGIYEHQRAMKGNSKRSVQMTRSGAFGLQHYATFSWSGDVKASWAEMKNQIPSGLNYTLCGIPFWNTDLGGFFYWDYTQDPTDPAVQELQTRWMQWGTFMPLMRNHCSSPMVSEIYSFGKEGDWAYDAMVGAVRLRYRLLPYIYSAAGSCTHHSGTMMRPLVMDFTADKRAVRLNDEYLFGKALLVKPVTDALYTWKDAKKQGHQIYPDVRQASAPVSVYLPQGADWYDFWTNERHAGGQELLRPCPITEIPVYVRAGSIVPFGPEVQYSSEKPWDSLEVRIYPGADGSFTLYEDEGDKYNYERGQFTEIPFTWNDQARTLTIGQRQGRYKGMLRQRTFRIVLVTPQTASGSNPATAVNATVNYTGQDTTVKL